MRSIVVGTAGHIDHGKSALVRALTGVDPDRLQEEKDRGITIDLGFAHATIGDINFAFVDVPGHERFVKNMLAGIGGIDLVVLVVAADESVMPQTREHFDICRLLRVPAGIVALTKTDLADADTIEVARIEVRELTAGSFLEDAPIVPVSVRSGAGLDQLRAALVQASRTVAMRASGGAARMPIDRVFSMKGFGTVVTGTLAAGTVAADRDLAILPGGRLVKVRGLQVHGRRVSTAVAGQRCAVNLGGVEVSELARGQDLISPGTFAESRVADAVVEVLPGAALRQGARVRFHRGTAEVIGRVAVIGPEGAPVGAGQRAYVRLRLESPVVLARGDRYILRSYSPPATIAGGVVLDPQPPRRGIRSANALARCAALEVDPAGDRDAADRRAAAALVADAGAAALPRAALVVRVGIDPAQLDPFAASLVASGAAVAAGEALVAPAIFAALEAAILGALAEHHRTQPLSEGVPREELRAQLFRRGHAAVFDRALANLSASGQIALRDRIALASHRPELSPEEARARDAIERAYLDAGLTPPELGAAAAALGAAAPLADRIVKLLVRQKVLVRVEALLFHDAALTRLKREVASLKTAGGPATHLDVATFKERFGVTRKFAIPLLEYLDRERVTRRTGDSRLVL
jgi:selenocysteine-specific elongation factor